MISHKNCVLQLDAHRVWVNSLKLCAELLPHNCAVTERLGNKPHCPQHVQEQC